MAGATISLGMPTAKARRAGKARAFVFASGKGGTGKTNLATNVAIAMARISRKVVIFDADLGLANVEVLLGIRPRYSLRQVIFGRRSMREILVPGPEGISVISGGSGIRELASLTPDERTRCIEGFSEIENLCDTIIVDTSAGISPNVLSFLFNADEIILVTTPEPTALTDAYALIKVVAMERREPRIRLIVNMARNEQDAASTARKIQAVTSSFLNLHVDCLGYVPLDENVRRSVESQVPVLIKFPESPASKAISILARRISNGVGIDARPDQTGEIGEAVL